MKLTWKMPVESIIRKAEENILCHLNVVCILEERNAEKEGRKILDALMKKRRKLNSFYWVIVGLPFKTLEDYPKLDDSVTCVSSMKCVDPDLLLKQKDLVIMGEGHKSVADAASRARVPVACLTDKTNTVEKTDDGWLLPANTFPVDFVWSHMLPIADLMESNRAVRVDEEGQPLEDEKKPLRFVSCCDFEKDTHVDSIIKALERLTKSGVRFHWTFVGSGELYGMAQELVAQYQLADQVKLVGRQTNPLPYIRLADVYVQFSCFSEASNCMYEAMVLGVPALEIDMNKADDRKPRWGIDAQEELEKDEWVAAIMDVMSDTTVVATMKTALEKYRSDSQSAEKELSHLFTM